MEGVEAHPLHWPVGWPRVKRRERARFDASFSRARDDLFSQLRLLGARYIVLSTNIPLRRDGRPYANQPEPNDPGVAVYFEHDGKQMTFACDRWDRVRDNIRAVGKTIEAIRGIERWGASDMMERAFSAFEALPAPGNWRDDLGVGRDATADDVKRKFRDLVKIHHPDCGGDPEQFQRINRAYEAGMREAK
jgi:hypothetical protein